MAVITRAYDTYSDARRALDNVTALNLPDVDGSVIGNESLRTAYDEYDRRYVGDGPSGTATGAGVGAAIGAGTGLLAGLGMLAIPGLGPVVAAGWLAATAAGAAGGAVAGGAVGALADLGIPDEEVPIYSEAINRGSVLASVRFPEEYRSRVQQALDVVPSQTIAEREAAYTAEGWHRDETAAERTARYERMRLPML